MQPANPSADLRKFFTLTFIIAWITWIPIYLGYVPDSFVPLGFLGPITSASILAFKNSGKEGLRALYSGLIRFKTKPFWYLAIFLPAILTTLTHLFFSFFFEYETFVGFDKIIINYLIISIFLILEEVGWRGYALPRLLSKRNAFNASLILGFIWAIWHFPFWAIVPIEGAPDPFYLFYITGSIGAISMSVILTWIFNNTHASIALTTLCHASFNATIGAITFSKSVAIYHNLIFVLLSLIAMVILYVRFGPEKLTLER